MVWLFPGFLYVYDMMPDTFLCHQLDVAADVQSAAIEKFSPAVRRPASVGRRLKAAPSKLLHAAVPTEAS